MASFAITEALSQFQTTIHDDDQLKQYIEFSRKYLHAPIITELIASLTLISDVSYRLIGFFSVAIPFLHAGLVFLITKVAYKYYCLLLSNRPDLYK